MQLNDAAFQKRYESHSWCGSGGSPLQEFKNHLFRSTGSASCIWKNTRLDPPISAGGRISIPSKEKASWLSKTLSEKIIFCWLV